MAGYTAGGGSRVDYTGPNEPADPDQNEVWLDTDADPDGDGTAEGQYKRYGSDGEWHATSVDDHRELKGVLEDSHHSYPIPTDGLLDQAVTAAKVAFDYVTPTELSNHAGDPAAHHQQPPWAHNWQTRETQTIDLPNSDNTTAYSVTYDPDNLRDFSGAFVSVEAMTEKPEDVYSPPKLRVDVTGSGGTTTSTGTAKMADSSGVVKANLAWSVWVEVSPPYTIDLVVDSGTSGDHKVTDLTIGVWG